MAEQSENSDTSTAQSTPPARGGDNHTTPPGGEGRDFNPRPPRGGRPVLLDRVQVVFNFNPRPPARGATWTPHPAAPRFTFQSTPPARGGDLDDAGGGAALAQFQSTPPREGGDCFALVFTWNDEHFNPRPPARGATAAIVIVWLIINISIHAPREGGRLKFGHTALQLCKISIHAPHEGGDRHRHSSRGHLAISIHAPARGATIIHLELAVLDNDFNPRPPRGGRPAPQRLHVQGIQFQSTPPARGGDHDAGGCLQSLYHFNPRPPRGGRLICFAVVVSIVRFQSTPPARGGDEIPKSCFGSSENFNPRPPRGGATRRSALHKTPCKFQSTPPARGAT